MRGWLCGDGFARLRKEENGTRSQVERRLRYCAKGGGEDGTNGKMTVMNNVETIPDLSSRFGTAIGVDRCYMTEYSSLLACASLYRL